MEKGRLPSSKINQDRRDGLGVRIAIKCVCDKFYSASNS